MALYKETSSELLSASTAREYFRFEGGKTNSRFDINSEDNEGYIYISNSLNHHMYFSLKRIKQILNREMLELEHMPLTCKTIRDCEIYPRIKNLILYDENLSSVYSFRLGSCPIVDSLLRENAVYPNRQETKNKSAQRVDRRVYGGGYGLSEEWKRLFAALTYYTARTKITRKDLLELLAKMRATGKLTQKDNIKFLLSDNDRYQYRINHNLESDFHKYSIIDALESILERGEAREDSTLANNPKKTIRRVVEEYERGREKTLRLLETHAGGQNEKHK